MFSVHTIADSVMQTEFDYDVSAVSFWSLSGWFNENIGQLNVKINKEFFVESGIITPTGDFGIEEGTIYKQIYLCRHYNKKVRDTLRGTESLTDFISLQEGDSRITRVNKNELAKTYRGMANDAQEELDKMVAAYNLYQASPRQVTYSNTVLNEDEDSTESSSSSSDSCEQEVFSGYYGGGTPTQTPTTASAIADDLDSPYNHWVWNGSAWT